MRIPLAVRLPVPGVFRIGKPPPAFWPFGATLILSNQPMGSSAALVLLLALAMWLLLRRPLPAVSAANCALVAAFYLAIGVVYHLAGGANLGLLVLYEAYLSICALYFIAMRSEARSISMEEGEAIIGWLLGLDLLLNVPAVLLQLAFHGIGDFIGGLSGLFLAGSLSQGRTNTVRAGMLMAIAFSRYGRRRDALSAASAAFNMTVLLIALSMTTILSAFGAGMLVVVLGKRQRHKILKVVAILGLAVVGGAFNKWKYGVSYADYILALNYHYHFTPKLNIYKHTIEDLLPARPWIALVGDGLGNFMNRFAILFNFENYSGFPFKQALMRIFDSPLTREHLIERYRLEEGIVGNSIISVPWNSAMTMFLETGVLGILTALLFLRGFIRDILKEKTGVLGSGLFFLAFFGFNLLWDIYLDYPEVLFPFFMLGLLMGKQAKGAAGPPLPG